MKPTIGMAIRKGIQKKLAVDRGAVSGSAAGSGCAYLDCCG